MNAPTISRHVLLLLPLLIGYGRAGAAPALYDFGNPNGSEQLYIELVNRARADAAAEGARLAASTDTDITGAYNYFGVNLTTFQSEMNALPAVPPLAPNSSLMASSRSHSAWMLANATQSHNETNPSNDPSSRAQAAGYNSVSLGENVYAHSKNPGFGHASFEVDWGPGSGGMQPDRGHRTTDHSSDFREIGVGVVTGINGDVGPETVTEDFGRQPSSPSFGTGVVYYDLNKNGFYDVGEGISGVTVNVSGASYYCKTATGGGWTVPVPATAATRTVSFSGLNLSRSMRLAFPASTNAKADVRLNYYPPKITSSNSATAGQPYMLAFKKVPGAGKYTWQRWKLSSATPEYCESTINIKTSTTGSYSVLCTTVKQQGTASFHLENSTGDNQSLELNKLYYGNSSPALAFQSMIRYATPDEHFKVQIKEEGTSTWVDALVRNGTGTAGEAGFVKREIPLSSMAGKAFRVRFLLESTGSYFRGFSGVTFGWLIDSISFSGVSIIKNRKSESLTQASGSFTPAAGKYLMAVSPVISYMTYPSSYLVLKVAAATPAPGKVK